MKNISSRLASFAAVSALLIGGSVQIDASFRYGRFTYEPLTDSTCSLIQGDEYFEGELVIPSTVTDPSNNKQYTVTAIGKFAFEYAALITSVEFPSTLETLGLKCFSACNGLTDVTLPASLRNYEERVFEYCTKLNNIFVEDGNQFYKSEDGILYNYVGTEIVQVPQARTEVTINPNTKRIGYGAFYGCDKISEVVLPEGIVKIEIGAFQDCYGLRKVNIPATCKIIEGWAFDHCSILEDVDFEDGCEELGSAAFQYCGGLETLRLPDTMKKIAENGFMGCYSIRSLYLGESIASIASDVFTGCDALREIVCPAVKVPSIEEDTFDEETYEKAILYVPDDSMAEYADHDVWQNFLEMLPLSASGVEQTASDNIKVEISKGCIQAVAEGIIELYNMSGVRVAQGNGHLEAALAHGIYLLRAESGVRKIRI